MWRRDFGRVSSSKADDMHAQARTVALGQPVAVVTDSSADLPGRAGRVAQPALVPLRLNFGDQDFLDKIGMSTGQFYRRLRESEVLPRTSQPAPGDFRRPFEFLFSHHPSVVYVGVARAVSGTLQSAETAAQRGEAEPHPHHRQRQCRRRPGAAGDRRGRDGRGAAKPPPRSLRRLEALRPRTRTWAMTRDLSMAVRGGRLPAWSQTLVQGLGLTPIARVKPGGKLGVVAGLFGARRLPERFAATRGAQRVDPQPALARDRRSWRCARSTATRLLAALRERVDCTHAWLVETGPAIGAHAGPGTLVVSVQPVED